MKQEHWSGLAGIANLWREEDSLLYFLTSVSDGFVEGGSEDLNRGLWVLSMSGGFFDKYPLLIELWARSIEAMPLPNPPTRAVYDYVRPFLAFQNRALGLTYWLRSRIPGYPIFLPLGLAKGTVLSSPEASLRLNWPPDIFRLGLQFQAEPPWPGFSVNGARNYRNSSNKLLMALKESPAWVAYSDCFEALSPADIASLKDGRRRISSRLLIEQIDAAESKRMVNRAEFRNEVVHEELQKVTEGARRFSLAFDRLDNFITDISQTILGWMILGGTPTKVTEFEALVSRPGGRLSFRTKEPVSKLAYIDSPLTPDVFRVVRQDLSSDQLGLKASDCEGIQIPGFPKTYELLKPGQ